jgi:hypothetical protein
VNPLAQSLAAELTERPRQFGELVEAHMDVAWRDFLLAWGELRAADILGRDDEGRYVVRPAPSPR